MFAGYERRGKPGGIKKCKYPGKEPPGIDGLNIVGVERVDNFLFLPCFLQRFLSACMSDGVLWQFFRRRKILFLPGLTLASLNLSLQKCRENPKDFGSCLAFLFSSPLNRVKFFVDFLVLLVLALVKILVTSCSYEHLNSLNYHTNDEFDK